jgi:hypothetical protein
MDSDYYVSRKPKLLKEFDKTLERTRGVFVSCYGAEPAELMLGEARQEYAALIPQLPYIGGKEPFTGFLIHTAWALAMYRVLQRSGESVEEVGALAYQVSQVYIQAYPALLRRVAGYLTFSRHRLRRLQKGAVESHQRRYPGGYVYDFVAGDGATFDFGVDYIECASVKFLNAQGACELAPYICPTDILYSQAMGWGLMRTTTLAEGAERCDFRFKKGGETKVTAPAPLEPYITADWRERRAAEKSS